MALAIAVALILIALSQLEAPPRNNENRENVNREENRVEEGDRENRSTNEGLYGEPLPWDEVKHIFPRYTTAYLVDVETGLRFEVTRRGGTYHADVQPLTALDSEIFSRIYQGRWSWKRRAVIVETGLRRIAGSINGMPHGAGKIEGNNFRGHFCVHFLNSRVHLSGKVDTAHQMMVWKAAGRPLEPFLKAGPGEVIDLVVTALDQGECGIASLGLSPSEAGIWLVNKCLLGQMPGMALDRMVPAGDENGNKNNGEDSTDRMKYRILLSLTGPGERGKREKYGEVEVFREQAAAGRWLLEGEGLKRMLEDD